MTTPTPTPFNWQQKPSEIAPQLCANFVRNKKPVPIVYSAFQKAKAATRANG